MWKLHVVCGQGLGQFGLSFESVTILAQATLLFTAFQVFQLLRIMAYQVEACQADGNAEVVLRAADGNAIGRIPNGTLLEVLQEAGDNVYVRVMTNDEPPKLGWVKVRNTH